MKYLILAKGAEFAEETDDCVWQREIQLKFQTCYPSQLRLKTRIHLRYFKMTWIAAGGSRTGPMSGWNQQSTRRRERARRSTQAQRNPTDGLCWEEKCANYVHIRLMFDQLSK